MFSGSLSSPMHCITRPAPDPSTMRRFCEDVHRVTASPRHPLQQVGRLIAPSPYHSANLTKTNHHDIPGLIGSPMLRLPRSPPRSDSTPHRYTRPQSPACPRPHPRPRGSRCGNSPPRWSLRPLRPLAQNPRGSRGVKSPRNRVWTRASDCNLWCDYLIIDMVLIIGMVCETYRAPTVIGVTPSPTPNGIVADSSLMSR